jgi:hypothetical protein
LGSDTLLPTFGSIWKSFFNTLVIVFITFAVTSSALVNLCLFRTLFSYGNRKKSGGNKPGEFGGYLELPHRFGQGTFCPPTTDVEPNVSE